MPIILPQPYELSEREQEIYLVMGQIESAVTGTRSITLYDLAASILDEVDGARASAEAEAEWLASLPEEPDDDERLTEAEEQRLLNARRAYLSRRRATSSKPPKPRIRVRAATGRTA